MTILDIESRLKPKESVAVSQERIRDLMLMLQNDGDDDEEESA